MVPNSKTDWLCLLIEDPSSFIFLLVIQYIFLSNMNSSIWIILISDTNNKVNLYVHVYLWSVFLSIPWVLLPIRYFDIFRLCLKVKDRVAHFYSLQRWVRIFFILFFDFFDFIVVQKISDTLFTPMSRLTTEVLTFFSYPSLSPSIGLFRFWVIIFSVPPF